nr:SDR family NAD(P)-dependent oxidoreductase [Acidobacteriota bacterium]
DGRCKTFDAAADGFVKSEGCGVVVLKTLKQARKDGDTVLAVIRGSATNHDGRSSGLTVPNGLSQEAVIRAALADGDVSPDRIGYVEAHGTGTSLGDPIEAQALMNVLRGTDDEPQPLLLGSVKTNIGHTESAAGIAGLIKAVLCLNHGEIPPNLHFEQLNPAVEPGKVPLVIPTTLQPWPDNMARFAGVSSFGIGGTNAHVVLEAPPETTPAEPGIDKSAHLLVLSAHQQGALRDRAASLARLCRRAEPPSLAGICREAGGRRTHLAHRLAVPASDFNGMADALEAFLAERPPDHLATARVKEGDNFKFVFYYPGQGSQWAHMGLGLMQSSPVFKEKMLACDAICRRREGWSILEEIEREPESSRMNTSSVAQPTIFAVQVALSAHWAAWGIRPDAVVGHSMGEVAAAHVAGILSLEDAMHIICRRSALASEMPVPGAMAVVELAPDDARQAIAGFENQLAIAAHNGPATTVLSGEPEALNTVLQRLEERDVFCRLIKVEYASHCPQMDALAEPLGAALREVSPKTATIPFFSTVEGRRLEGTELNGDYWVRNIRRPVLFFEQISELETAGYNAFVEISPHPLLTNGLQEAFRDNKRTVQVLPSLRRDSHEVSALLETVGRLYVRGYAPDWTAMTDPGAERVALPAYPWQRQRFWATSLAPEPVMVRLDDVDKHFPLRASVHRITSRYGFAPRTMGQATGKRFLFLDDNRDALFFINAHGGTLTAINYTGPETAFSEMVSRLEQRAGELGLNLAILEESERHLAMLHAAGWATTSIGVWQTIGPLDQFTMAGSRMRKLRYAANRYAELEGAQLTRFHFGRDTAMDARVHTVMDRWAAGKQNAAPLVAWLEPRLRDPLRTREDIRYYCCGREDSLDGVLILSPCPALDGFLLDMEFYGKDAPFGCMEFAIVQVVELLKAEGFQSLSLGITLGTRLEAHRRQDDDLADHLKELHGSGLFNGDANLQFKNKFRPQAYPSFLCCRPGDGVACLEDFLVMLGDPTNALEQACPLDNAVETPWAEADHPEDAPVFPGQVVDLAWSGERVYRTRVDMARFSFLSEHRVLDQALMPYAGILALFSAGFSSIEAGLFPRNIEVHSPMPLQGNWDLQARCQRDRDAWQCRLYGRLSGGNRDWRELAGAESDRAETSPADMNRESLEERLSQQVTPEMFYSARADEGYDYGSTFRLLRRLHLGTNEALALIDPGGRRETEAFGLSPAWLDACLQPCLALLPPSGPDELWLPAVVNAFTLSSPPAGPAWVHCRMDGDLSTPGFDLDAFSEDGRPLFSVRGLSFLKNTRGALRIVLAAALPDYWSLHWNKITPGRTLTETGDNWFVLNRDQGWEASLASALQSRTGRAESIEPASLHASLKDLVTGGSGTCNLVFWAPSNAANATGDHTDPLETQKLLCGELLSLLHELDRIDSDRPVKVRVLTTSAQHLEGDALPVDPHQHALWGFGRVLASEQPERFGGLVDWNPDSPGAADALAAHLKQGTHLQACLRGDQVYTPQLQALETTPATLALRDDRAYLISGGLGALGRACAQRLLTRGARHLVLLGRSRPSDEVAETIASWREQGAVIDVHAVDVGSRESLAEALQPYGRDLPALGGVFHAAGVLDDGLLLHQDWSRFGKVFHPKIRGACWLHQLTRDQPLDYFVLYSSASSCFGLVGQAAYAAANAYMEAFAETRRALGLPATAVQWGHWRESGLTADLDENAQTGLARLALRGFSTREGLDALERLAGSDTGIAAYCPFVEQREQTFEVPGLDFAWRQPAARHRQPAAVTSKGAKDFDPATLRKLSPEEQKAEFGAFLTDLIAMVLGADPKQLDPEEHFSSLGLDSIMSMKLRNRIRDVLDLDISLVKFFKFPSIDLLSEVVREAWNETHQQAEDDDGPSEDADLLAKVVSSGDIDSLSEDQVEQLLQQMLEEGG